MTESDDWQLRLHSLRTLIRTGLSDRRLNYTATASMLQAVQAVVKEEAVTALTESLNAELERMPSDSYEQKKALAAFVNTQMRQFGLAVKCPRTGCPGVLQANTGNYPAVGRFRIEVLDERGNRRHHTSAVELPKIELTVDTVTYVPHRSRSGQDR